jgi:membrane-bound metal-dependent hydrolase YbcI (DUF457 family)
LEFSVKGIAHFITGVALATFFPEVVAQAAQGSLLPMLGGIAGILPDTIDFKFARYFEEYDLEIDPGAEPDAREIAEQIATAMRRAYETEEPQRVMLHTIRIGSDLWRQYTVRFDPGHQGGETPPLQQRGAVEVRIGPVVDTSQVPLPGSEPSRQNTGATANGRRHSDGALSAVAPAGEARVDIGAPIVHTYDEEIKIDIFSGPSFKFERQGDRLRVHFLDWHRRWSHSLTLAALLGLGTAGVAASIEFLTRGAITRTPLWAGLIAGLSLASHVLEDQLGFMGSNLFYPFTRTRTTGLQLLRSGDAVPNFLTVWTATALILFNLDRFSTQPRLDPRWFLGLAVALPILVLGGLYRWQRRRGKPEARESLQQRDIVAEAEEIELG